MSNFYKINQYFMSLVVIIASVFYFFSCSKDLITIKPKIDPFAFEEPTQRGEGLLAGKFVDPKNGSDTNSGESWDQAFQTITKALESSTGMSLNIYIANNSVILDPELNLANKRNIVFIGGYGPGDTQTKSDSKKFTKKAVLKTSVKLDIPLISITGLAKNISFQGIIFDGDNKNRTVSGILLKGDSNKKIHVTNISFDNCEFIKNNFNTGDGGALQANYVKNLNIRQSEASENTANNGGFLHAKDILGLELVDNKIKNNIATNYGAGIFLSSITGEVKINKLDFDKNKAKEGGGIYASGLDNHTMSDLTFTENKPRGANSAGAAMYFVFCKNISLSNIILTNNGGPESTVGAIAISEGENFIIDFGDESEISGNRSGLNSNGTVLDAYRTKNMLIRGGKFTDNISQGDGGVFSFSEVTDLSVESAQFVDNKASNGGVFYLKDCLGKLNLSGLEFENNKANTGSGGAIYIDNSGTNIFESLFLLYSSFRNNHADLNGGAVYILGKDFDSTNLDEYVVGVNDVAFENNTAEQFGGAWAHDIRNMGRAVNKNVATFVAFIGTTRFTNNISKQAFGGGGALMFWLGLETHNNLGVLKVNETLLPSAPQVYLRIPPEQIIDNKSEKADPGNPQQFAGNHIRLQWSVEPSKNLLSNIKKWGRFVAGEAGLGNKQFLLEKTTDGTEVWRKFINFDDTSLSGEDEVVYPYD